VLESALDAAAARDIAARHAATYIEKNNKVRPNSPLGLANSELERAEAEHAGAAAAVEALDEAVRTIDAATATIAACDAQLADAREEMDTVRARQRQAADRGVRIAQEESAAVAAEAAHAEAVRADAEIVACHREIAEREAKMAPALKALADLEAEELACGARCDAAAREMADAGRLQTAAATAFGLLDLQEKHETLLADREGIAGRCARIAEQRDRARTLEAELATIPAVTEAQIIELSRLDRARESADATLQAIATRVEVTQSTAPVMLGGARCEIGSAVTITAPSELVVGGPGATTVRITPGGGRTLAEATQRFEEARAAIEAALAAAERDLTAAGEAVTTASAAVTAARDRLDTVMNKRHEAGDRLRVTRTEVEALRTKAAVLEERHGTERATRMAALDDTRSQAAARLQASHRELQRLPAGGVRRRLREL
jgi:chromosome segregation ATPase